MRVEFAAAIEKLAIADEKIVFITGDLGFGALENLKSKIGDRFINAGVAEQNMISVAAGMAYKGFKVICYSIAPFVVYRCLEQFKNDVCLHNLPVMIVGNGGGYGYGIMGSSHHAIEDLAALSALPNVKCYIPSFSTDVEPTLTEALENMQPSYLRLGYGAAFDKKTKMVDNFRLINEAADSKSLIIGLGPIINNVMEVIIKNDWYEKFNLATVNTLPLAFGKESKEYFSKIEKVLVAEEHVSIGGIAQQLALNLLENQITVQNFVSLNAKGYPTGTYGDQRFHQTESGLDPDNIYQHLLKL